MLTPGPRFLLLLLLAVLSVIFAFYSQVILLLLTTAISLFLLWDYLKRGTVPLAMKKVREDDMKSAGKILKYTTYPQRLLKSQKIYYNIIQGFLAREEDRFNEAEQYLLLVKNEPLKDEDKARVLIALTDIQLIKQDKTRASEYFNQLNRLKVRKSLVNTIQKMKNFLEL